LSARAGFTLAELLVAGTLTLLVLAGLAAVVDPSHAAGQAQAAAADVRLRLRAAFEALSADIRAAGSGPVNGAFGRALGAVTASVLPLRVGSRGDPVGTVRSDALSLISAAGVGAAPVLAEVFAPDNGIAQILTVPGCPVDDPSCGLRAGMPVLLVDEAGQSDLFNTVAATGQSLNLAPRGAISGRPFPAGSLVIPVSIVCYYLAQGTPADGMQLMQGDGDTWDLPYIDHVTGLTFELLGDPLPPRLGAVGPSPGAATYGPAPPPIGTDDDRDDWPAGQNCTFLTVGVLQQSRMPTLSSDGAAGLVRLPGDSFTDGPWCPDGSASNRYDADLLRVRAVRVTIRVEAGSASVRGADEGLFLHPGSSPDRSGAAADRLVVFDVVPRVLQAGR
jgi:hypothetical protein